MLYKPNNKPTSLPLSPLCSALALMAVLLPSDAISQETVNSSQKAIASDKATLEEVIVTARRRDESLAHVPIAVTAMGTEQLADRQVQTDSDLQAAVPGLTIRQTQGNNSLTYSIRGQSADTFSGSPSAVVAYMNEVPLTVSGASTFYDLESVQVLKGPQGTLFGRNASAGAISMHTRKAEPDFGGSIDVGVGEDGYREFTGAINVPLTDSISSRFALYHREQDDWID
uniref:TonB-dependent receptor n=1 Tax=Pseudomaricurvus sp. TaxID=2004510 RepID=UPI003F6A7804